MAIGISKSMTFGELELAFTTTFAFRWNDRLASGKYHAGFYHPAPTDGFHALGTVGVKDYKQDTPPANLAALCVRGAVEEPDGSGKVSGTTPLAYPTGYTKIWKSKNNGGKHRGSCWRPIAPAGYRAMGDVFVNSYDSPPGDKDVVCVRDDLTVEGKAGDRVYDSKKSGANKGFTAWMVELREDCSITGTGYLTANTFLGMEGSDSAKLDSAAYVLKLPYPVEQADSPAVPVLESRAAPARSTTAVVDRVAYVPFTSVTDDTYGVDWKVANSPFYQVRRLASYDLVLFEDNDTSSDQQLSEEVSVGVDQEVSVTFSAETGIEVGVEAGISAGGVELGGSLSLSFGLGFSTTGTVTMFEHQTVTRTLTVPAGTAVAMWVASYTLELRRTDRNEGLVGNASLEMDVDSFYTSQYPAAGSSCTASADAEALATA